MHWWLLKTFALLHDPPHKPLVLGRDHAEVGRRIAAAIRGREIAEPEKRAIEEADHIASGADRAQFLRDLVVDPRRELTMIHPLDGTTLARERNGALEFAEVPIRAAEVEAA